MRPSNLQLRLYFVTDLSLSVNPEFDLEKDVNLHLDNVIAEPECQVKEDDGREWQIKLRVRHTQNPDSNSPYFFAIELVGFFRVEGAVPDDRVEQFAFVNGTSVLFSSAREILRSIMASGPYDPIVLPAVCFLDAMPESAAAASPPTPRAQEAR